MKKKSLIIKSALVLSVAGLVVACDSDRKKSPAPLAAPSVDVEIPKVPEVVVEVPKVVIPSVTPMTIEQRLSGNQASLKGNQDRLTAIAKRIADLRKAQGSMHISDMEESAAEIEKLNAEAIAIGKSLPKLQAQVDLDSSSIAMTAVKAQIEKLEQEIQTLKMPLSGVVSESNGSVSKAEVDAINKKIAEKEAEIEKLKNSDEMAYQKSKNAWAKARLDVISKRAEIAKVAPSDRVEAGEALVEAEKAENVAGLQYQKNKSMRTLSKYKAEIESIESGKASFAPSGNFSYSRNAKKESTAKREERLVWLRASVDGIERDLEAILSQIGGDAPQQPQKEQPSSVVESIESADTADLAAQVVDFQVMSEKSIQLEQRDQEAVAKRTQVGNSYNEAVEALVEAQKAVDGAPGPHEETVASRVDMASKQAAVAAAEKEIAASDADLEASSNTLDAHRSKVAELAAKMPIIEKELEIRDLSARVTKIQGQISTGKGLDHELRFELNRIKETLKEAGRPFGGDSE